MKKTTDPGVLFSAAPLSVALQALAPRSNVCCLSVQGLSTKTFKIVDLVSGKVSDAALPPGTKGVVAFSRSGKLLFASGAGWFAACDPSSGKEEWRRVLVTPNVFVLSCDDLGSVVVAATRDTLYLVKKGEAREISLIRSDKLFDGSVNPEGSRIAAILDDAVILFDAKSLQRVGEVRHLVARKKGVHVFWLEGSRIAVRDDKGIDVYSTGSNSLRRLTSIAGADTINQLATKCLQFDETDWKLRLINLESKAPLPSHPSWKMPLGNLAYSNFCLGDSAILTVHENGQLRLWKLELSQQDDRTRRELSGP